MTKPAGFYHIGEQALGAALYMNRTVPSIPPSLPRNLDPISTYRSFKTSSASTDLFSLSFQTAAFLGGSVEAPLITSNLIFVPEPIKTHHSFGNTFLFFSVDTMDSIDPQYGLYKRDPGGTYLSSRGTQGLAVSVIFTFLATAFVGIRIFTRLKFLRTLESNDWMVVVALVGHFANFSK